MSNALRKRKGTRSLHGILGLFQHGSCALCKFDMEAGSIKVTSLPVPDPSVLRAQSRLPCPCLLRPEAETLADESKSRSPAGLHRILARMQAYFCTALSRHWGKTLREPSCRHDTSRRVFSSSSCFPLLSGQRWSEHSPPKAGSFPKRFGLVPMHIRTTTRSQVLGAGTSDRVKRLGPVLEIDLERLDVSQLSSFFHARPRSHTSRL